MAGLQGEVSRKTLADHRREWTAERIGWSLAIALLVAAALGVFGDGPLSRTDTTTPDGALAVEYARFARANAPTMLRTSVRGGERGDTVRIGLDREYAESIHVETVQPEPVRVTAVADWYEYEFSIAGPATIVFRTTPDTAGRVRGRMRLGDGAPVEFTQLVYP